MVALKDVGDSNLELKRMFVHTDHQGQGIGKLLVQNLLNYARKTRGPDSIISLICTNSRRGALQFYQNLGFRQINNKIKINKNYSDLEHIMTHYVSCVITQVDNSS